MNYRTSLKTTRMTATRDDIDSGAGAGKLKIGTAAMAEVLCIIPLSDPCGSVTDGVLTLSGMPLEADCETFSGTKTAAEAIITTSADDTVVSGLTVGTSGSHINLDSVSMTSGKNVRINSATITHG